MAVHTAPNPHADWARTRSGALPENTTMDTPKSPTLAIRQLKRPDLVAQEIKRLITEKNLSPGDRLPRESELQAQFQVSKGTIREALKSLEVQGLITISTGPSHFRGPAPAWRAPRPRA